MPVSNIVIGRKTKPDKIQAAKTLRHESTDAEKALWARLRRNGLGGWHFRRQQVIAGFIVDFYCHAAALVIEVDGAIHASQASEDEERGRILEELGYRIVRLSNQAVLEQIETVLQVICKNLTRGEEPNPKHP